ncbi:MAG: Polysaccharide/polyol phosphate transporter ATP-binding protein [Devosia sp.]|nr:Polysaccharide/polyol phosphate transporter ATP-binding protein [Devosia sp.]
MIKLEFHDVTVRYAIYNSRSQSLRNQLINIGTGGRISQEVRNTVSVTALEQVNFALKRGDRLGLIGHNGAGKTTMLRTMAGIYQPVSGKVIREGRVSTIIEIGAGMDPELSGFENIVRMSMLLGQTREQIAAATPRIVAFTDLGEYLAMPVRTYSSGMTMRLMFAVATSIQPDILLIDEMFGTGDADFQTRAEQRMHELIEGASIFVFASHAPDLIRRYCNRVFRLEHGKVREIGMSDF